MRTRTSLSIVVPGIRKSNWWRLYKTARENCDREFELIIVGPTKPDDDLLQQDNVRYIEEYSSPSRCAQISALVANGDYFTWVSDDGFFLPNGLTEALRYIVSEKVDQLVMRYFEGINFSGGMHSQPDYYWVAGTHDSLRLPGIPPNYLCAPLGLLKTDYFKKMGGFDTRFEHINMCCNDLSFRIQHAGGKLALSPLPILNCDWSHISDPSTGSIMMDVYNQNDLPLFQQIYNNPDALAEREVNFNNFVYTPSVWKRRWKIV